MRTETVPLHTIHPDPANLRRRDRRALDAIKASLARFGQVTPIVVDARGVIRKGNGTWEAARELGWAEIEVIRTELAGSEAIAYSVADNRTSDLSTFIEDDLATTLRALQSEDFPIESTGFTDAEVDELLERLGSEAAEGDDDGDGDESEADDSPEPEPVPADDLIWPSDNAWGIPALLPAMQAASVVAPLNRWGAEGRAHRMSGTYHFYSDDYKFSGLWRDPAAVVRSGCAAAVEPNYSTNAQMPRAVALGLVYRKRWLARYWQANGVRVFVDLAMDPAFRDLALLGVPRGWTSYATYTYTKGYDPAWLDADFDQAVDHAGTDAITFLVYGGDDATAEECRANGWLWFPAHQQAYFRNVRADRVRADHDGTR